MSFHENEFPDGRNIETPDMMHHTEEQQMMNLDEQGLVRKEVVDLIHIHYENERSQLQNHYESKISGL